ncbi:MAG TPA: hypothetical protein VFP84_39215 [Kofleriaceae bacterium]|nr:hypothetical protein [Kofleriaceae bacterium]
MLFPAPEMPAFPAAHTTTAVRYPRFEDCAQDGRLLAIAVPAATHALWENVLDDHPGTRNSLATGVLPLLTRWTVRSFDQPVRVDRPLTATMGFELAHERDAAGAVARLYLNVWAEARGLPGRINVGPPPALGAGGEPVAAGWVFAEHTFTRPFAPAGARRVTSLAGIEGYPALPEATYRSQAPASAAALPDGARWLDALAPDVIATRFTLDQTDGNQHVNSLVYVRLFLDAAQRRLAAGGHPALVRSTEYDIAFRKPSFAGDTVRAHLRMFAHGDQLGAAGFLAADGEADKPRCFIRVAYGA